jgi:hypothetical protein
MRKGADVDGKVDGKAAVYEREEKLLENPNLFRVLISYSDFVF